MEFTALHLLWLFAAFTLTKQASVGLKVSPTIAAECDRKVFLHCNTSAQPGLSVKRMAWSQGHRILCFINEGGNITSHKKDFLSDFHCEYEDGQLTLVFQSVLPLESGDSNPYLCKLQSNKGTAHAYTTVELQECSGTVQSNFTSVGPSCTFNRVYPDGDVDWFQGSQNLSDGSVNLNIAKSVNEHGWLTIRSWLTFSDQRRGSHYNCSLKNPTSGRYITSALVLKPESQSRNRHSLGKGSNSNRIGSEKTMTTVLSILVLLIFTWE